MGAGVVATHRRTIFIFDVRGTYAVIASHACEHFDFAGLLSLVSAVTLACRT